MTCMMLSGCYVCPAIACQSENRSKTTHFIRRERLRATPSSRPHLLVQAVQQNDRKSNAEADDDDDNFVLAEVELKARRNRKRKKLPQSGSGKPEALKPETIASGRTETFVLQSLALGFCFILLQGVSLAASGFLPQAADDFIVGYIYPSFSYQLGFFFTCSTAYGLWKTSATK